VSRFVTPTGNSTFLQEPQDLTANHLRLWARNNMEFLIGGYVTAPFGWVNDPWPLNP
jgi:hypothetical protein